MGGPEKIQRQHDAGRLTVRERLAGAARRGLVSGNRRAGGTATYHDDGELASFTAS